MKKLVQVQEVEGEGLVKLLGERVLVMCANYFYAGVLSGVNDDCIQLSEPSIVYETGEWTAKQWKDSQRLPGDEVFIQKAAIESYMRVAR